MGAPATSLFFDSIIKEFPCVNDRDYLEIFVHNNSRIPDRTEAILYQKESPLPEILRSAMIFDSFKVDYIVMACVTSYYYAKTIQEKLRYSTIIDILSTTAEYINLNYKNITKVGILASTGAIKTNLWQSELSKYSIESIILPDKYQEKYIMDTIYGLDGLKSGNLSKKNKNKIISAANQLIEQGSQMILAGCSEIPMIIGSGDVDVAFIDSFKILRDKIYFNCYNFK